MSIQHHPSDETLLRYAAGTLIYGPAVVIATHLSLCPSCAKTCRGFSSIHGALLESETPIALAPKALARVLARLDDPAPAPQRLRSGGDLPAPLAAQTIGPWRWLAPGIHLAHVGPRSKQRSVFLLRCGPGSQLPAHHHQAAEYSCVIRGSYSDASGRYEVGDTEEMGDPADIGVGLSHAPRVDPDSECIALIAVEGKLRFDGWLPRLLQPLFGI